MGNRAGLLTLLVALMLVAGPLAGCLGSPSDSPDQAGDDGASTDEADGQTGDDGAGDGTSGTTGNRTDGNETGSGDDTGPTTETTTTSDSAQVLASTQDTLQTPGFILPRDEGRMTVLDSKPSAFTGVLVEVEWTSETDGAIVDHIQVEIRHEGTEERQTNAPDSAWMNDTRSTEHTPVRIWVLPDEYENGSLEIWAHPIRDQPGLWLQAEITAHTTVFRGGTPIWNFTAL